MVPIPRSLARIVKSALVKKNEIDVYWSRELEGSHTDTNTYIFKINRIAQEVVSFPFNHELKR